MTLAALRARARERRAQWIVAGLAVMTILWAGLMELTIRHYPSPALFHHNIGRPVLALQLVSSREELSRVLGDDTGESGAIRPIFWKNTLMDCLFIPLYTSLLAAFTLLIQRSSARLPAVGGPEAAPQPLTRFVITIIGLVVLTGLADYAENAGIFHALLEQPGQTTGATALLISVPSRVKWFGMSLALLLISHLLFRTRGARVLDKTTAGLVAISLFLSAVLGFWGLVTYPHLQLSAKLFAPLVLACALALW